MALREELEKSGHGLFRWRSYPPLIVIGLSLVAFQEFKYPFGSELWDDLWEIFCMILAFAGLALRMLTVGCVPRGTSGRNTRRQVAEALNTTGMYSIVRNPLYLGNFIIWSGLALFARIWWLSLIIALVFWIYYERIIFAEEEFLREKYGRLYLEWAEKTPAFIPRFSQWRSPAHPFSPRTAFKREYSGFLAIIATFTLMEIVGDYFVEGVWEFDTMWRIIAFSGMFIYLVLRILKKTGLLDVEGRP